MFGWEPNVLILAVFGFVFGYVMALWRNEEELKVGARVLHERSKKEDF